MKKVPVERCQNILALIWAVGALCLISLLAIQTMTNKYGNDTKDAWAWLLPTIVPTVTLILTVAGTQATQHEPSRRTVKRTFFAMTVGVSIFYLVLVTGTLFYMSLAAESPVRSLQSSVLFLSPVQGAVGVTLGVFFATSKAS